MTHGKDHKRPDLGVLAIDVKHLAPFLTALPPGARQSLRWTMEGSADVMHEIVSNPPEFGERAGISSKDFDELLKAQEQLVLIDESASQNLLRGPSAALRVPSQVLTYSST